MKNTFFLAVALTLSFLACKKQEPIEKYGVTDATYLRLAQKKLTDIVITDIFTPPVASRIYAYPLIAAYEAGRYAQANSKSLVTQLKNFEQPLEPEAGKEYDYTLASLAAFFKTADKVIFSKEELAKYGEDLMKKIAARNNEEVNKRSIQYGEAIAELVIKRLSSDNYKETRGMERFVVSNDNPARWIPTLPDYADALEPHWMKMQPLTLDSAAQCKPVPPPVYDENENSDFWKEVLEVYNFVKVINENHEHNEIATFWDDNPFVSRHKGHLMFQDKKMTPAGHWLAICRMMTESKNLDFYNTSKTYALTSVALYDAFISCWDEKYRSLRLRPETVIKAKIEKEWKPWLVSPPFPAYTSGHSTVSAAAAEILTFTLGDNIAYRDTTEKEYGLPIRNFQSFRQAALEASNSRIFAGIHYRSDCEIGNKQGIEVAKVVLGKVKL